MRALSIRQPYAELILRGVKTAELRSWATTILGERFYIYAAKAKANAPVPIWSDDLQSGTPPAWMVELAEQVKLIEPGALLPTGGDRRQRGRRESLEDRFPFGRLGRAMYRWHLADVKRAERLRRPERHAQPAWFKPF